MDLEICCAVFFVGGMVMVVFATEYWGYIAEALPERRRKL